MVRGLWECSVRLGVIRGVWPIPGMGCSGGNLQPSGLCTISMDDSLLARLYIRVVSLEEKIGMF